MNQTAQTKKSRLTPLDLLVVVLLLSTLITLIVHGALARRFGLEDAGETSVCTLTLSNLSEEQSERFHVDDTLSSPQTGETLGVISAVRRTQSEEIEGDYSVVLTLDCLGFPEEGGLKINNSVLVENGQTLAVLLEETPFVAAVSLPE